MEAVVFCGIQGSGKTTFYLDRFAQTHVRLSLDLLKTRHREQAFLRTCLETGQRFVVDNTNPTVAERRLYVEPARAAGFPVVAYFFTTAPREAVARNQRREGKAQVPVAGVLGTFKRQEAPTLAEGFAAVYRVRAEGRKFRVETLGELGVEQ